VQLPLRLLPQGPIDAVRQWLLFGGAYYFYRLVRGAVDGRANQAFDHARSIVDFERSLHTFVEVDVQHWSLANGFVIHAANWMYINSHFVVTMSFLIWLYFARNHAYYFVRNMFMVAMGLALVSYIVYPTAPPRFLPEYGFQDTVASFVGDSTTASASLFYNPFAAVPSMHCAFALMIAVPALIVVKNRVAQVLWCLYPALVAFVVVATGNHFWVDILLGGVTAGIAAVTAEAALARARPHAWSFRTQPAEAAA
jgi:hypothetical protein